MEAFGAPRPATMERSDWAIDNAGVGCTEWEWRGTKWEWGARSVGGAGAPGVREGGAEDLDRDLQPGVRPLWQPYSFSRDSP